MRIDYSGDELNVGIFLEYGIDAFLTSDNADYSYLGLKNALFQKERDGSVHGAPGGNHGVAKQNLFVLNIFWQFAIIKYGLFLLAGLVPL